ncbi:hypothetical protein DRO29_06555, partial [Candidatus Bathyarchaeota archaeon]
MLKIELDWNASDVSGAWFYPVLTDPLGNDYGPYPFYNSIHYSGCSKPQYFMFENPQPGEWKIEVGAWTGVTGVRNFTITTKTEKEIKMVKREVFMTHNRGIGGPSFVEVYLPEGDTFDTGDVKKVKISVGCTGVNCIKGHGAVTISVPKDKAHLLTDQIDTYFWNAFLCYGTNYEGVQTILTFQKAVEIIVGAFIPAWAGLAQTAMESILDMISWLQTRDYSYGSGPIGPEWTDIDKYEIYSFSYSTGSIYTGYACNRIEVTLPVKLEGRQDIPIHIHIAYTWWDGLYTTKYVGHEETITFKPKPDFHIDVASKKYFYDTDETAKVTIDVTNNRDEDTEIWLGVTFKDPEGNEYDIPLKHAEILKGETKSFDMKWIIDKNRNKIVSTARQQLGKPYEWGAEGPDSFDCSGLIYYSYSQAGINIPRTTAEGYYNNYCDHFSNIESLIAGDLLFVYNTSTSKIEHVGILTANNTVIHASSYYGEVVEEPIKSFWNRFGRIKSQYWPEEKTILGRYEIAVNCWKDAGQTDKYTDDLEWEPIFYVYNLDVVSPTTSSPAIVGDPSNPAEFNAKVSTGLGELGVCLLPTAFKVKIGGKPAKFQIYQIDLNGNYYFKITPPVQDTEGSYDLNISVNTGEISDYDLESNAVIYSTGGNIDVVEVIDRSGSMSGEKIQSAKDSAKLFVDLMRINDSIGVVSYSSSASVNYGLTKITSETIKQDAKNAIDGISAGGYTSIGAGLRAA